MSQNLLSRKFIKYRIPVISSEKCFLALFFVLICSFASKGNPLSNFTRPGSLTTTVIIWNSSAAGEDSVDQLSFLNTFETTGFLPAKLSAENIKNAELGKSSLIVIPHASALILSDADMGIILKSVSDGARLITDGESPLSGKLNIKLSGQKQVRSVIDHTIPFRLLRWPDKPSVSWIEAGNDKKSFHAAYTDSVTGHALGVIKSIGKGKILFLSPLFDPVSGKGYSRFPTIANTIITGLNCSPSFRRQGVDAYFDPGYRYDMPVKKLVSLWKQWGIRSVHVSAWNIYDEGGYNYKRLINEAHKQGILVYAWLEWPYVGKRFWDEHPEWREKNALQQDSHLDFLYLMDLQNPDCMKAALRDLAKMLKDDWDGIDIAEFSITGGVAEALEGPKRPDYFTGFNFTARREFESLHGFDPEKLFDQASEHYWKKDSLGLQQFYKYRVQVNNRLLRHIVSSLDSIRVNDKRDWEFVFTVLDNSLHPEFDQLLGFDLAHTRSLANEFHSVLQVEDPLSEWARPPERYKQLADAYAEIRKSTPFAIDINVVAIHPPDQKGFASAQPTGIELFQQYKVADKECGRVCLYCEWTVFAHDWKIFPFVMASDINVSEDKGQWLVKSEHTISLICNTANTQILIDGKPWPCFSSDGVIVPKGSHKVSFDTNMNKSGSNGKGIRLTGLSDELNYCRMTGSGIEVSYSSPARCALTFSSRPENFKLDGMTMFLPVLKHKNEYVVMAPSGNHILYAD